MQASSETAEYTPGSNPNAGAPPVRGPCLSNAHDVWKELRDLHDADREHFVCFDLDSRHQVIERRIVHIGTLGGVDVHPREVFRPAIKNGAAAVIVAHNHPSGNPTPSAQDIQITDRLRRTGADICGIPMLDHVVFHSSGWVSLADRGWR